MQFLYHDKDLAVIIKPVGMDSESAVPAAIIAELGGECYTIYKNLSAELPESTVVGAAVKAGDVIGTVGESAMIEVAEEPHLHLEMTVNGLQVDPMDYFDDNAKATLNQDVNYEDMS